jgi:hypothetical protein
VVPATPVTGPQAQQFFGIPSAGWVKVTVPLQALEAFLASPAGATATLASEGLTSHVFRIDAREAQAAATIEGVDVRADFHQVWLRRGMLDTRSGARGVDGARHPRFFERGFAIVQLQGPVDDTSLEALRATGVELVHYLPQNAYLVWIADATSRAELERQTGDNQRFAFVDAFLPEDALSPLLDGAQGLVEVVVQVHNAEATRALSPADRSAVAQVLGFATDELFAPEDVLGGLYTNLTLRLPAEALATLVELERVVNIEPYSPRVLLSERQAQEIRGFWNGPGTGANGPGYFTWLVATKTFPTTPTSYPVISVVDGGVDNGTTSPVDSGFKTAGGASRIVGAFNFSDSGSAASITGHGNLCASVMGGFESSSSNLDGGLYLRGIGVNPFARLSNIKVFNDSGLGVFGTDGQIAQKSIDHGATISSNSWGTVGVYGIYNTRAQSYDSLTRDSGSAAGHQPLLFVFAAGNSGASGVNAPGTAKNALTVGASEGSDNSGTDGCGMAASDADNIQQIASFSGRGPTVDARTKPEIVVPGTHVVGRASQAGGYTGSAVCDQYWPSSQSTYTWGSGTSFSAPAVSGVQSLFTNYLSRIHSIPNPSPALLKAYTLHQTRYLGATGGNLPNGNQGYGTTWLDFAFDGTVARKFVDQSTTLNATGEYRYYSGTIADTTRPFRIALAWSDAPGSTVGSAWANDLDLVVTVGGNTYRGNVFTNALSTTGGSADTKNNYELVVLPTGLVGTVTVRVNATNIVADGVPGNADATDQDFALVMANVNFASGCTPAQLTSNLAANSTSVCAGSPLVLSVAASGSGLSYKFYRNGSHGPVELVEHVHGVERYDQRRGHVHLPRRQCVRRVALRARHGHRQRRAGRDAAAGGRVAVPGQRGAAHVPRERDPGADLPVEAQRQQHLGRDLEHVLDPVAAACEWRHVHVRREQRLWLAHVERGGRHGANRAGLLDAAARPGRVLGRGRAAHDRALQPAAGHDLRVAAQQHADRRRERAELPDSGGERVDGGHLRVPRDKRLRLHVLGAGGHHRAHPARDHDAPGEPDLLPGNRLRDERRGLQPRGSHVPVAPQREQHPGRQLSAVRARHDHEHPLGHLRLRGEQLLRIGDLQPGDLRGLAAGDDHAAADQRRRLQRDADGADDLRDGLAADGFRLALQRQPDLVDDHAEPDGLQHGPGQRGQLLLPRAQRLRQRGLERGHAHARQCAVDHVAPRRCERVRADSGDARGDGHGHSGADVPVVPERAADSGSDGCGALDARDERGEHRQLPLRRHDAVWLRAVERGGGDGRRGADGLRAARGTRGLRRTAGAALARRERKPDPELPVAQERPADPRCDFEQPVDRVLHALGRRQLRLPALERVWFDDERARVPHDVDRWRVHRRWSGWCVARSGRGGRRLAGLPADGPALEFALGHAARGRELDLVGAAARARARLVG